ncbi:MAG TPA: hypothetical protein VMZ69_10200 [Saprospiraceae bacterium]|nr:hypothetical protein [Saprospiraceae bacterium]
MKNYFRITLLMSILIFNSCGKEENVIIEPPEDEYIYSSDCIIDEVFWLLDNTHIVVNDGCDGTIKKINTLTGSIEYFEPAEGYIIHHIYVSPEIADRIFYVAHGYTQSDNPFKLFSFNLETHSTSIIKEGLTLYSRYGVRGNKFVLAGNPIELFDLETGESEFITEDGYAGPLSPDGSQLLIYTTQGIMIYDFACQCTSMLQAGPFSDDIIWNNSGLFSYKNTINLFPYTSFFSLRDLISGELLLSPKNFSGGPWSAFNGGQLLFFTYDPEIKFGDSSSLVAYDCNTKKTRVILTCPTDSYYPTMNQTALSISPDQTKIAFRVKASLIQVSQL